MAYFCSLRISETLVTTLGSVDRGPGKLENITVGAIEEGGRKEDENKKGIEQ